ncbi:serine carboxypeptidase [Auricularia subglabra TFB-10046 SS5]|uniref:Carboxypeptidase n=1 Tax=Auricularia subglabra (strain TFB-10046 / SS5) TaxID=717982 RepID=J0LGB7_AURST|nr:serine carboxypeptidase [Auricularia subglabra TFB-10046 SS5]
MPLDFPAPEQDLGALSADEFTSFTHPAYPAHSVRIKRAPDFCNNKAKSYAGYIDIEARHLFFHFHESRSDPDKDPVVMWINGGPGCSSALGAFMELGPCNIHDAEGPKHNPYSWNSNANLFILDQPIGVGFSYADHGEFVSTTEEAAVDVAAFVAVFFETFSKFKGRPFHMSGESYGGRYLPVFASAVYDSNAKAVADGRTPVNLQSVLIGNGITNFAMMSWSYYDMTCTNASVDPILPISTCVRMKAALPRCKAWHTENCLDKFDGLACGAANDFCVVELTLPFLLSGRNPYNIAEGCPGGIDDLCYPLTKHIRAFLDRADVRRQLGVDKSVGNFTSCAWDVNGAFREKLDQVKISDPYVAELLQRNIPVLVYVGTYDWICNWVGNLAWTSALKWPGHEAFNSQELREWTVDGARAGLVKSAGPLTYATVDAAGHMVPYDKPAQALEMLNRWLAGKDL